MFTSVILWAFRESFRFEYVIDIIRGIQFCLFNLQSSLPPEDVEEDERIYWMTLRKERILTSEGGSSR
jgi:hypothetical protein